MHHLTRTTHNHLSYLIIKQKKRKTFFQIRKHQIFGYYQILLGWNCNSFHSNKLYFSGHCKENKIFDDLC
jgi:hypothetical protein